MFLLNLSLAEFLALFGAVSGLVLALYLLDRARQKQTVATLRFWISADQPPERRRRRRRIQQPLSLLLQVLSIACLLLAIGQLRFGAREGTGSDHVLILDTSAWMGARKGQGTLMDEARALARRWLSALPAQDRVMLIRADALATPATVFEESRKPLRKAIDASQPGATALDADKALDLAQQVQRLHAARAGEIVFVGAGRVTGNEAESPRQSPPNLRILPVDDWIANCGLRAVGLRRSVSDPALWEVFASVRNYGTAPKNVSLALQFGGAPAGLRRLNIPPSGEENATFELRTRAAGWIEVRLLEKDNFPADDRAFLEIPARQLLKVAVYSDQPEWIRPVLAANPHVAAEFHKPSEYGAAKDAAIVILDRFRPPSPPAVDSIWIEPAEEGSPVRVRSRLRDVPLLRWRQEHSLATGLRTEDLRLQSTEVFDASPGDLPVAEVGEGPVILARPGKPKIVVLGFHPMRSAMRYELATPLLFANILKWMAPDLFRRWELNAGSVGSVTAAMDADTDLSKVRVLAEDQTPLPFTVKGRDVRFFAGTAGAVRLLAGDRELVYSMTLPEVGTVKWNPAGPVRKGIPAMAAAGGASRDLWQMLALLGGLGLLLDWLLFGRAKAGFLAVRPEAAIGGPRLRRLFSGLVRKAS